MRRTSRVNSIFYTRVEQQKCHNYNKPKVNLPTKCTFLQHELQGTIDMGQHGDPPAGARMTQGGRSLDAVCLRVDSSVAVTVQPHSYPRGRAGSTCTVDFDGETPNAAAAKDLGPLCTSSRISVSIVLFIIVSTCIIDVASTRYCFHAFEAAAMWLQNAGPVALLVFAALYAVVVVSFLPSMVLTVTGGYVFSQTYGTFGIVLSALASLLGGSIGAVVALLLGRYVLQGVAERLVSKFKILNALDDVLSEHGFEVVALLRMSPLVPYNVFNYIMGATRVKLRPFFFGSIGMVPGTVLWTVFGSMIHSIKQAVVGEYSATPMHWAFLTFGLLATVAVVALTARLTSAKLNAMAAAKQRKDAEGGQTHGVQMMAVNGAKYTKLHALKPPAGMVAPSCNSSNAPLAMASSDGALHPKTTPRLRTGVPADRRQDGCSVVYV